MLFMIKFLVVLIFLSDYFRYALNIGFLDKLVIFLSFFIFIINVSIYKRNIFNIKGNYYLLVFFYIIFLITFLFTEPLPFLYEIYKIFIFIILLPMVASFNRIEINKISLFFLNFSFLFLMSNLILMIFQMIFGSEIIRYIGMPDVLFTDSQKVGRYMGVFGNLPTLSLSALLVYIFNELFRNEIIDFKYYKVLKVVCILTIIISTSKIAYLILFLIILNNNRNKIFKVKYIFPVVLILSFIVATLLNDYRFINKIDQIKLITEYTDINNIPLGLVDWRFYNYIMAFNIFKENIFGLGLGSWGDFSSSFLSDEFHSYVKITMTDSAFSHLLVEHGVFMIIYIFVIIYPLFFYRRKLSNFYFLSLLSLFTTMGFSDSSWPLMFSFLYSITIFHKFRAEYD